MNYIHTKYIYVNFSLFVFKSKETHRTNALFEKPLHR